MGISHRGVMKVEQQAVSMGRCDRWSELLTFCLMEAQIEGFVWCFRFNMWIRLQSKFQINKNSVCFFQGTKMISFRLKEHLMVGSSFAWKSESLHLSVMMESALLRTHFVLTVSVLPKMPFLPNSTRPKQTFRSFLLYQATVGILHFYKGYNPFSNLLVSSSWSCLNTSLYFPLQLMNHISLTLFFLTMCIMLQMLHKNVMAPSFLQQKGQCLKLCTYSQFGLITILITYCHPEVHVIVTWIIFLSLAGTNSSFLQATMYLYNFLPGMPFKLFSFNPNTILFSSYALTTLLYVGH